MTSDSVKATIDAVTADPRTLVRIVDLKIVLAAALTVLVAIDPTGTQKGTAAIVQGATMTARAANDEESIPSVAIGPAIVTVAILPRMLVASGMVVDDRATLIQDSDEVASDPDTADRAISVGPVGAEVSKAGFTVATSVLALPVADSMDRDRPEIASMTSSVIGNIAIMRTDRVVTSFTTAGHLARPASLHAD